MTEVQPDTVVQQPDPTENLRKTYDWIRQRNNKFTVPFDNFQADMADPEKLSKVHEWITANNPNFEVPLEQFASDMGTALKKKEHKLALGQPGPEFTPPAQEPVKPSSGLPPDLKFDDEADRQKSLKALDDQLADQTYRLEHPDLNYQKLADLGKATKLEPTQLPGMQSVADKQLAAQEEHSLRQTLGIDKKDAVMDRPSSAAGTFNQGVVDTFMGALKSVDIAASQTVGRLGFGEKFGEATDPTQGPAYKLADWVEKQAKELFPNDPAYQGEIFTDFLPATAAALLSFHIGGALGKTTKAAELAIPAATKAVIQQTAEHVPAAFLASASTASQEYDRALAEGADPATAMETWQKDMFTGVPFLVSPTFKAFNKATDGYLKYGIKQFAQGGIAGGFQMATSHAIENLSAQQTYDKGREIIDGVLETGGSGFAINGLLSGVIGALTRRAATFSPKEKSIVDRLVTYAEEEKAKVEKVENTDFYKKPDEKAEPPTTGTPQGTEPVSKSPEEKPPPVQSQPPVTEKTSAVQKSVIPKDLKKLGEPVASTDDAKARFGDGERIFALHEQSETPVELFSVEQMDKFTSDQLLAYPKKETKSVIPEIKPEDIHALAKEAGIDYESKEFMAKSKELTGQEHLDAMSPEELTKVKDYIKDQKETLKLEVERDTKIKEASRPDIKLSLISSEQLVNSKNPVESKRKHDKIKNEFKELKKLIKCLYG